MTGVQAELSEASETGRRFPFVSWACALSPFALLFLFITVAVHVRVGLGHWPIPMFEDYDSRAFEIHEHALSFFGLFCFFGAGPLWLLCLLVRQLRPATPRVVVLQLITAVVGWVLMLGVVELDPTPFSAWFFD